MKPAKEFGRAAAISATVALAVGASALAAQAPLDLKGQTAVLRDLSACPRITEDTARLACYDKAARALIQAETEGEVVVVDRKQANEVRRQSFGFQIPSLNIFDRFDRGGRGDAAPKTAKAAPVEDINRTTITVASVGRTGDGKLTMTTDDGAMWVQTDGLTIDTPPRKGSQVNVVRARVGGYFCDVSRYQSVRCERRR